MSVAGIAEEITLDSGVVEVASITPVKENLKKVTLELVQNNKLYKTQRHVRVFDHKTLYIKEKVGKVARHILFDLSLLDEQPVKSRRFNKNLLIATGVLGLLAIVSNTIASKALLNLPELYFYGAAAALGLAALGCFVAMVKSFKTSLVFVTAHGGAPVLSLLFNDPNKSVFQQFTKALTANIDLARSNNSVSHSKLMPAIVGEHRRLFENNFISEAQYDEAKKKILSGG